ncbi:hypothetical protein FGG08_003661, partial [Glutinoglossum americanum]
MAPAGNAKKRDRGANFLDLGVAGRRTGVTLKDTGIRDEYGLEPIEGIFSSPTKSPEKSPTRKNGAAQNSTLTTEEEMDIGSSTAPEPTDVLSERRRTINPPPRARSPIKTFLNSPAKRGSSAGPISSSFQRNNDAAAKPAVNRKLDFSAIDQPFSRTKLPQNARAGPSSLPDITEAQGPATELPAQRDGSEDWHDPYGDVQQTGAQATQQDVQYVAGEDMDDSLPPVQDDDDTLDLVGQDTTQPNHASSSTPAPATKRGPGRPRKSEPNALTPTKSAAKRGRGRPPRHPPQLIKEETSDYEDARPSKRRRDASSSPELTPPAPAPKVQVRKKPPPSQRDPNARITSGRKVGASSNTPMSIIQSTEVEQPEPKKRGRPRKNPQNPALKPRSLYITRRETPTLDGALKTRSGRTSVKPCAYWRNERIVYGEGDTMEGEGYLLPTIKEVIRTEEVEPTRARRQKPRAGRKRRARTESESEDEDDLEPWEVDPGIMTGEVQQWNEELQKASSLHTTQT